MSTSQTQNFDVVYEISTARFLEVLRNLFINDLPLRLGHLALAVPIPAPLSTVTQAGFTSLPVRPSATLALEPGSGTNVFRLELTFGAAALTLQPIAGVLGGLPAVPGITAKPIGPIVVAMHLSVASTGNAIAIERQSGSTIAPLTGIAAAPQLTPPAGVSLRDLEAAVQNEVIRAVVSAIESLLPVAVPIALPTTGPCSVWPRSIETRFLAADAGRPAALAFLLTLRAGTSGNASAFTSSHIEAAREGALLVGNTLLRDLICCLMPASGQIIGLPSTPTETTDTCCRWRNITNVRFGGELFPTVNLFEICIGANSINVTADLRKTGTGWWATARVDLRIGLRHVGTTIVPVNAVAPVITVNSGLEWWVWLLVGIAALILIVIGAIVGFFIGGPPGAAVAGTLIGAGIGLLIGGIVAAAVLVPLYGVVSLVGTTIGSALGTLTGALGTLSLLPEDLTQTFGSLDLVGDPVIDDLTLSGRVRLPEWNRAQSEASELVLDDGYRLDLDRGTLFTGTEPLDLDADLTWSTTTTPGGGFRKGSRFSRLSAASSARLVVVDESFWSLTESDVSELDFDPGSRSIFNWDIPVHDGSNPPTMRAFGVRTTEGRFAKCGAWRDSSGRLHVRYRTWDTPRPLYMTANWSVTRGMPIGAGVEGFLAYVEHAVSRRGVFRAQASSLAEPVTYRWHWNGAPLAASGTLSGSGASYTVTGAVCEVRTAMGGSVSGDLCVTARDAHGREATVCRDIAKTGSERTFDRTLVDRLRDIRLVEADLVLPIPLPDPAPHVVTPLSLDQQLPLAIANGMKLNPDQIMIR